MEIIFMLSLCGFSTQRLETENYFVIYVLKYELYLPFKLISTRSFTTNVFLFRRFGKSRQELDFLLHQ